MTQPNNSPVLELDEDELIYDWNKVDKKPKPAHKILVTDETLRDGLQSPSVRHPSIHDKVYLLYLMADLGIDAADLGLCGAGERFKKDVVVLASEIAKQGLPIQPQSAGRTVLADIIPIVDASQEAGIALEAALFLGTSPIRQYAEGWTLDFLLKQTETAVKFAVEHDLPVMFVTEDTTRAKPETLRQIYTAAMRAGAQRICVCDTVGHATPSGVSSLVSFIAKVRDEVNPEVGIDWHGHRDRGMSIVNTLVAIEAGADRIHGCGIGIGERSGNTPIEQILVNLNLLGWAKRDLAMLPEYCHLIASKCDAPIPFNYPVVGADSFRTSTGVHAAAMVKAIDKGDDWLTDAIYCGVPAKMVGRRQGVEIGPMSGLHNVRYCFRQLRLEEDPIYLEKILEVAKQGNTLLAQDDVRRMVRIMRQRQAANQSIEIQDLEELLV